MANSKGKGKRRRKRAKRRRRNQPDEQSPTPNFGRWIVGQSAGTKATGQIIDDRPWYWNGWRYDGARPRA